MTLLQRLGALCAASAEAAEAASEGDPTPDCAGGAAAALGAALGALGPEAVLAALPLDLEEVRKATPSLRFWQGSQAS